ncbi:ATP-binding protein [Natronolimnohabitans innermongolicus]|uniref:histidine kinase n=1 Tax=Natronolimnohabitans innermongolicus JCM 12255 TaxID=1227499 RepID=L9XM66_9EURY|nr:ATP-binding protein [Natronolimnohabitans innermongolicus]ELY61758.1 integral membrane sensor signal transduction histidine kinase [Natronolimnohabitans innermongolicus JCM 12255]
MRYWNRLTSILGGRQILVALGALYVVVALGRAVWNVSQGTPLLPIAVITTFIGGSGLVLLVGGYRLPETDVHADFYSTIAGWCLVAIAAMLSILALYHLQPDTDLPEPNRLVPILTAFSAVGGYGVGLYAAQAKTNALELERRNRRLQRVQARLERSNERLEESNERLEQFAYAASHDLQEPLRMVSSYLQLIDRRYGEQLDDEGEEFLEYALDDVLADVRKDLEFRIDETNADVTVEELPRVEGNENQLRQLFQNLVSNALEYSGDEAPVVHVSAERDGNEWIVSVRDEGIGIEHDDHAQIFEIFQRLHTHEEHAGTGIGLALCKRIVERHGVRASEARSCSTDSRSESVGGDIWVESTAGDGSVFSVTLPALDEQDEDRSSESVSNCGARRGDG